MCIIIPPAYITENGDLCDKASRYLSRESFPFLFACFACMHLRFPLALHLTGPRMLVTCNCKLHRYILRTATNQHNNSYKNGKCTHHENSLWSRMVYCGNVTKKTMCVCSTINPVLDKFEDRTGSKPPAFSFYSLDVENGPQCYYK